MRNVQPWPGVLSTQMLPPLCFTMPYAVLSPSPVPLPVSFVVKNGSKMRACVSSSIPTPVSLTVSSTLGPGVTLAKRLLRPACISALAVVMRRSPPVGMASRAFTARFISTCSIWIGSTRTLPRSGARLVARRMSSPISRRISFSMFSTTVFRSTSSGTITWRRLNASSCRVSHDARSAARATSSRSARTGLSRSSSASASSV